MLWRPPLASALLLRRGGQLRVTASARCYFDLTPFSYKRVEYGYLATHSFAEGEIICSNMRYRGITIPLIVGLALGLDEEEPVGLASYSGDDISTPTQEMINGDDAGSGMPPWDDSLWLPLWCIYPDPAVINNVDRRLWCARPHPSNGKMAAHFHIF